MITEIADITVAPDAADAFPDAVLEGLAIVAETPGFRGARLTRSVETRTRFVLLIEWDSVEDHTIGFRESEGFARWRALVGPFFDGPPTVEHLDDVVSFPTAGSAP